jgi:hypothetical protein
VSPATDSRRPGGALLARSIPAAGRAVLGPACHDPARPAASLYVGAPSRPRRRDARLAAGPRAHTARARNTRPASAPERAAGPSQGSRPLTRPHRTDGMAVDAHVHPLPHPPSRVRRQGARRAPAILLPSSCHPPLTLLSSLLSSSSHPPLILLSSSSHPPVILFSSSCHPSIILLSSPSSHRRTHHRPTAAASLNAAASHTVGTHCGGTLKGQTVGEDCGGTL